MKKILLLASVILVVSLSASAQKSKEGDLVKIKALIETYKTSINKADTTIGKKVFLTTNEVNFIHPRGHEKGWEGIKKGIYGMFGSRFSKRDLKSSDEIITFISPDVAVLEFYWVFDATFSGEKPMPMQSKGRETQVLKKAKDTWKIAHVHYSNMPVTGDRQGF